MKKVIIVIVSILFTFSNQIFAEEPGSNEDYPKVHPIVVVFSNYHFGLNEYSTGNGFEVSRAYLGYDIKLSENFSFKTNLDVGKPTDDSKYDYVAYLKAAALKYHKNSLTIHTGLISLNQFKEQEKTWGYRYIYKSFQDQHKFGTSADFGLMLVYQIFYNLLFDATIRNGEGYKEYQSDNTYNGSFGMTYKVGKSFTLRGFYEYAAKEIAQSVYSGFLGYKFNDILSFGLEYNYMQNYSFEENKDKIGYSTYLTYKLNDKFQFFGRFDKLASNKLEGETEVWNKSKNGYATLGGIQYKLHRNVKISTNLQYWSPDKTGASNEIFGYINLEYKL